MKYFIKKIRQPIKTLYRPKITIYRLQWDFHLYDDDPFPSIPHGHSGIYKLDANNGKVYNKETKKLCGQAKKKEIINLHKDKNFQELTYNAITWYKKTYPQYKVTYPDWLKYRPDGKLNLSKKIPCNLSFSLKTFFY